MDPHALERRIEALPEAARREVEALVARLEHEHAEPGSSSETAPRDVQDHAFVGVWADRDDLADSVEWVRTVREAA
jgi:hypothetical protein